MQSKKDDTISVIFIMEKNFHWGSSFYSRIFAEVALLDFAHGFYH
jgi:hypothetical protein